MSKFISLLASIVMVFTASLLHADSGISTISYEGTTARFIIATPAGWQEVETKEPFDLKYVRLDSKVECFVQLASYKDAVVKNDITYKLFAATEALYGSNFFLDEKRCQIVYYDSKDSDAIFLFRYLNGSEQEQVLAFIIKVEDGNKNGTICMIVQGKESDDEFKDQFNALRDIGSNIVFVK